MEPEELAAYNQATTQLLRNIYLATWRARLEMGQTTGVPKKVAEKWMTMLRVQKEAAEYRKTHDRQEGRQEYRGFFVTINPAPETPLDALRTKVDRWAKAKNHQAVWAVYEQRSEDGERPTGVHVHAIVVVKTPTYHSTFSQACRQAWKAFVGNPRHVDVQVVRDAADFERRLGYITAEKADPAKHAKQAADRVWRTAMKIFPLYTYGATETTDVEAVLKGPQDRAAVSTEDGGTPSSSVNDDVQEEDFRGGDQLGHS